MTSRSLSICLALGMLTTVAAADKPHFDSKIRDSAITIDGRYDDWYGNLDPFGNVAVAVQFLNDGDFLYMRLTATDAGARMQILRQGLTVWFDPAGGTKKRFGVRFPVVERGSGGEDGRGGGYGGYGGRRRGGGGGDRPEGQGESERPDDPSPSDRVDLLGPGKNDARALTRDHLQGIDVAIHSEQGALQYELKVPLAKTADRPYALEVQPGKMIGVGLETRRCSSAPWVRAVAAAGSVAAVAVGAGLAAAGAAAEWDGVAAAKARVDFSRRSRSTAGRP